VCGLVGKNPLAEEKKHVSEQTKRERSPRNEEQFEKGPFG
jgi:hypothetical protein